MIEITKSEAEHLREKFHNLYIAKTRHKYYVSEELRFMRALPNNTEAKNVIMERNKFNKRGDYYNRSY